MEWSFFVLNLDSRPRILTECIPKCSEISNINSELYECQICKKQMAINEMKYM